MTVAQSPVVDPGYRVVPVRLAGGRISLRFGLRAVLVTAVLVVVALAIGVVSLATGDFVVPIPDVLAAIVGNASPRAELVVMDWRMPRVLLALMLGAALGAAGAVFQSLTRNPLGSPDILGLDVGAYTGALLVIIAGTTAAGPVAAAALAGGLLTALLVYGLAYRRGLQGFRLIIVGIAVSAMLASLDTWLILSADLHLAISAAAWGAGSLNTVGWGQVVPSAFVLAVLWSALGLLARPLHATGLGDDAARALGVRLDASRLALVVVGVALTATATAVAGPIAFVALAAPQLARRLTGSAGVTLSGAAAMGACLLAASDFVAQHAFAPTQLPLGLVTVCIGGMYLIWLLIRQARR
ncbi:FecCD family ABC transporter permease [Nakamurella sp.]|uniref:FecCD family ABC transporter permease n=1 Tax=Nakamurella sp. TaxID=1869182 RepID=UPI003B3BAD52